MLVCVHIFFTFSICINTPLQLKACKVNTFYIEEDVLKGCFMIDILNRIQIDSNLNYCLFDCFCKYC